jgi:tryptophanyl-tRNA synthetase
MMDLLHSFGLILLVRLCFVNWSIIYINSEVEILKRVFSGVQPSGQIQLGNYVTMKNFVNLQDDNDCIYCVVDMHSITVPQDPAELHRNIRELTALYVAIGIDPEKSTLFCQSSVPEHAELAWILMCHTYMGELGRMTQYKEKSRGKSSDAHSAGLFTYPVLMAADILLYDANYVPVGDDQKQHLELARDVAIRFNNKYGETFIVPEPMISRNGARIMSLDDPTSKMSKSNPNDHSKICLLDSRDKIKKSIMKATTDSEGIIRFDESEKPGVSNLLTIYSKLSGEPIDSIVDRYQGQGYGNLKKDLVEVVISEIEPIQARFNDIMTTGEVEEILRNGRDKARALATPILNRVKEKVGFYV